ncbi:MAG: aldo/keto reductase [Chloroflexi bacterium]|nr:aldo/keto reductase [Chloroflexota bacterium]
MEKRVLGRTGHASTVVCFGTAGIGRVTQEVADEAVEQVLTYGVNHIDIAPTYGEAMERMKPWMPRIRERMFLGAKTGKRSKNEAWDEINDCMRRLGVDSFDLFQLHYVSNREELDKVTGRGGALEALVEMRDQGLTRFIGITGHGPEAPRVQIEALDRFDFDTVMFPLSAAIHRNAEYRHDAERLLALANERNVGVHTIKMIARGGWGDRERECTTWYDPHRDQEDIDAALWWVLSQPMHTAPSAGDVRLLPKVLSAAQRFEPLHEDKQAEVIAGQQPPLPEPALGIPSAA